MQADDDVLALLLQLHALRVRAQADAFAPEHGTDLGGDVVVLARQQLRRTLHYRHVGAEAPVHLGELQADVAAADDHQVRRREIHLHDAAVGEEGDVLDPWKIGHRGARADIDEDALGFKLAPLDRDAARSDEFRVAVHQRHVLHARDPFLQAVDRLAHDAVLAPLHALHVDAHAAGGETVLGAAARHMTRASARAERLGGNAAGVDAAPPDLLGPDARRLQAFHEGPHPGGAGVNTGGIPPKTLRASARAGHM